MGEGSSSSGINDEGKSSIQTLLPGYLNNSYFIILIFVENSNTMPFIIFQYGWDPVPIHYILIGFEARYTEKQDYQT